MTDTESMRKDGKGAAMRYLHNHPELLAPWLQGVTTRGRQGRPGGGESFPRAMNSGGR